jgi:hypothetical protein
MALHLHNRASAAPAASFLPTIQSLLSKSFIPMADLISRTAARYRAIEPVDRIQMCGRRKTPSATFTGLVVVHWSAPRLRSCAGISARLMRAKEPFTGWLLATLKMEKKSLNNTHPSSNPFTPTVYSSSPRLAGRILAWKFPGKRLTPR